MFSIFAIAAITLVQTSPAVTVEQDPTMAALEMRVEALTARLNAIREAEAHRDSLANVVNREIVTRVGPFIVSNPRELGDTFASALHEAWRSVARRLGEDTVLLQGMVFTAAARPSGWRDPNAPAYEVTSSWNYEIVETTTGVRQAPSTLKLPTGTESLRRTVEQIVGRAVVDKYLTNSAVVAFGNPMKPALDVGVTVPMRLYGDVVASPYYNVQECFAGDYHACELILGLGPAEPFVALNNTDLKTWVMDLPSKMFQHDRRLYGLRNACLDTDDWAACRDYISFFETNASRMLPLNVNARELLIDIALDVGGPGALRRYTTTEGDITHRLEQAAGTTIDSLVRTWFSLVQESGGRRTTPIFPHSFSTIAWILIFGGLALRSSRWK